MTQIYTEEQLFTKLLERADAARKAAADTVYTLAEAMVSCMIGYFRSRGLNSEKQEYAGSIYEMISINGKVYSVTADNESAETYLEYDIPYDSIRMDDIELAVSGLAGQDTLNLAVMPVPDTPCFAVLAHRNGRYHAFVSDRAEVRASMFGHDITVAGDFTDGMYATKRITVHDSDSSLSVMSAEYVPETGQANCIVINHDESTVFYIFPLFQDLDYPLPEYLVVLAQNSRYKAFYRRNDPDGVVLKADGCSYMLRGDQDDSSESFRGRIEKVRPGDAT